MTNGVLVAQERRGRTESSLGIRPRGARRFRFQPLTEVYIPPTPYWLYYGSASEEAEGYVKAGECLVLRRAGGPDYLRPEVVNSLKARGWEERVEIKPGNGFNVKVVTICPPAAESRIHGLGVIHLGQAAQPAVTTAEGVGIAAGLLFIVMGAIASPGTLVGTASIGVGSSVIGASVYSAVSRRA